MTNAADERALKDKKREEERITRQEADDFLWVMSQPEGRRFVWMLMRRVNVFGAVFNTHGGVMNFNEGRRDSGLFLLGRIDRLCPELFAVMAAENAPKRDEKPNDD